MIVDLSTNTFSRQTSTKIALFVLSHLQIPGFLLLEKHVGSCNLSVYKPSIPIFARIIRLNVRLRARSDFSGALYKDIIDNLSVLRFLSFVLVSDFYQLRVWFLHRVLLDCLCPAPSQTRSEAPECTEWPKGLFYSDNVPIIFSAPEALLCSKFCWQSV